MSVLLTYQQLNQAQECLSAIVTAESKRPMGYEHLDSSIVDLIEAFLQELQETLDADPTPQYLYDHSGGEPVISAQEQWLSDHQEHLAMHR